MTFVAGPTQALADKVKHCHPVVRFGIWDSKSIRSKVLPFFSFLKIIFIEFTGVTVVNKIIWGLGVQLYNVPSVYCMVCSPPRVKLPHIPIYHPHALFSLLSQSTALLNVDC